MCSCRYCDLDGQHRTQVVDKALPHPFAITLFEEFAYITDWNRKVIEKINKFVDKDRKDLVNLTHRPMDIQVVHPLRQPLDC